MKTDPNHSESTKSKRSKTQKQRTKLATPMFANSRTHDWRKPKQFTRNFGIEIEIPPYDEVVEQVLNLIEVDQLEVFDPLDERALEPEFNEKGELLVLKRATQRASIREWLCVGCQRFSRNIEEDAKPGVLGWYKHNAHDVLFRPGDFCPTIGPGAFIGEIYLADACFPKVFPATEMDLDRLRFIIAHELVHVFDMMRLLIPAFQNWNGFWSNVLQSGCSSDLARGIYGDLSAFVDSYGTAVELASVKMFWPSHAKKWFDAVQK